MTDIPESILEELAKFAASNATEEVATMADLFAERVDDMDGPDALRAFAASIRATSNRVWPMGGMQ